MSKYYPSYNQYFGAQRCCSLKTELVVSCKGEQGPSSIGPMGHTGEPGPTGPTGRPGCSFTGPTGPPGSKTFVINHPIQENKYLVHACLEGPEDGVFYRGTGEIVNNEYAIIELPYYVSSFANDFTIQITKIRTNLNSGSQSPSELTCSLVENNSFYVFGTNCKFFWTVFGKRGEFIVEPLKAEVFLGGDGPYQYIKTYLWDE